MNFSEIDFPAVSFVTGVGTDVGKSIATGWLAREMKNAGLDVITQKMIQTGNTDMSEDIVCHRKLMGTGLLEVDLNHVTAPIIYTYPASPHLAAAIDGKTTDLSVVDAATATLSDQFGHVIIEGAGGLMVPVLEDYLTADYLSERKIPTIVVINGQLGSINHALLTLHAIETYQIPLFAVIYNPYFDKDEIICADTKRYLRSWLSRHFPSSLWLEMPAQV